MLANHPMLASATAEGMEYNAVGGAAWISIGGGSFDGEETATGCSLQLAQHDGR